MEEESDYRSVILCRRRIRFYFCHTTVDLERYSTRSESSFSFVCFMATACPDEPAWRRLTVALREASNGQGERRGNKFSCCQGCRVLL